MRLTKEQEIAINCLDKNIILNAGAGTGKTEVLTRRYVELVKDGVSIESIVCITFTKKAAKEMKERIRELLVENNLLSALNQLGQANISTIDSFCHSLLTQYASEAGIDLKYKLDNDLKPITIQRWVDQLLRKEEYVSLVSSLNYSTYDQAKEDLIDFILQYFDLLDLDELEEQTLEQIETFDLNEWKEEVRKKVEDLRLATEKNKRSKIAKFIHSPSSLEELNKPGPLSDQYIEGLEKNESNISADGAGAINESLKKTLIKGGLQRDGKGKMVYQLVFRFLREVKKEYEARKNLFGVLDYHDLTKLCLELLDRPEISQKILDKYSFLMVDEYQDSSTLQKDFFYRLASRKQDLDRQNFFVVGDPKQSIYGFRGAKDSVFEKTKEDILRSGGLSVELKENFRSTEGLLSPINRIFSQLMEGRYQGLKPMRTIEQSRFYASPFDNKVSDQEEVELMIGFITQQLVEEKKALGDFTFLFRSLSGMKTTIEELEKKKIPHYVVNSRGFLEDPLIKDLMNYLHYMIYKDQISQVAVLKGAFYNLSDVELYDIYVLDDPQNVLKEMNEQGQLMLYAFHESISQGLEKLLDRYPIDLYYSSIDDNLQIQANLLQFTLVALAYDLKGKTFLDFFYYFQDIQAEDGQMPVENEASRDVVKLMTIHQSKGLSMDSVLLPGLNKRVGNFTNHLIFHEGLGLGIRWENPGGLYPLIKIKNSDEAKRQEENLYYVAMTRAKNNLFLGISGRRDGFLSSTMARDYLEEELQSGSIRTYSQGKELDYPSQPHITPIKEFYPLDRKTYRKSLDYYNITMVHRFLSRPENYFTSYEQSSELEIDDEKHRLLPKNQLGLFVHAFAEAYNGEFESLFDRLKEEFSLGSLEEGLARECCQNFIAMNPELETRVLKEVPFHLNYKERIFTGVIDRIEIGADQVKVIDFKVSSLKDQIVDFYQTQLNFYAYVLAGLYPEKELLAEIQNLQDKNRYFVPFNPRKIEKELDQFIDFIEHME